MSKLNISRRNFLRGAGVASVVGATAAGVAVVAPSVAKADYDSPASWGAQMAITYLDEPSYNLYPYADADKLERMEGHLTSFNNATLHEEISPGYDHPLYHLNANQIVISLTGKEGWSLRDIAAAKATGYNKSNSCDWGIGAVNPFQDIIDVNGPWDNGEAQNSLTVKKIAALSGAGATGICAIDERWLYKTQGGDIDFTMANAYATIDYSDTETEVSSTAERIVIPKSVNRAVVLVVPLDGGQAKFAPSAFNLINGLGYTRMTELVEKVALFIRYMGYTAIPCCNETAMSVPLAIDAGLGELGRHGLVINPEYGSAFKICKVLTDMPLEVDKPITFGAARFCLTCGKCAEVCPSKSIATSEEPTYDTYCEGNNAGMKKWYVNVDSCFKYWVDSGSSGCNVCATVCTYSKPQTWVHDVVKVVAAKTSMFNAIFATMDDAFGYGKTWFDMEDGYLEEWWADESFTRAYDWTRDTF